MYTALCRVSDSSFTRGILDLLGDAAGAIGGPVAGTAVRTGVDMVKRLGGLLGADGVATRFGVLDGSALGSSGYRIFAGAGAEHWSPEGLVMDKGQLRMARKGAKTIDDVDYLVVALEYRKTLVSDTFEFNAMLPFHALWGPIKENLLSGNLQQADQLLKDLAMKIATSPDLVEADRYAFLAAYLAQVGQWKHALSPASPLKGSGDGGQASITTQLADMAERARREGGAPVASILSSASRFIHHQSHQKGSGAEALTDASLARAARSALDTIEKSGPLDTGPGSASARLASAILSTSI
jgi:hypothetical protein